jgi:hypothetical protein
VYTGRDVESREHKAIAIIGWYNQSTAYIATCCRNTPRPGAPSAAAQLKVPGATDAPGQVQLLSPTCIPAKTRASLMHNWGHLALPHALRTQQDEQVRWAPPPLQLLSLGLFLASCEPWPLQRAPLPQHSTCSTYEVNRPEGRCTHGILQGSAGGTGCCSATLLLSFATECPCTAGVSTPLRGLTRSSTVGERAGGCGCLLLSAPVLLVQVPRSEASQPAAQMGKRRCLRPLIAGHQCPVLLVVSTPSRGPTSSSTMGGCRHVQWLGSGNCVPLCCWW